MVYWAQKHIPGFRYLYPSGTFYAFANIEETGWSSGDLADLLLEKTGVATLDGARFGEYGQGFVRFSYANREDNIRRALSRTE